MKIKYEAPKTLRIKNYGFIWVVCNAVGYWWSEYDKKWMPLSDIKGECCNTFRVKSVKAFKRRLKEWSKYMPKGTKFILVSRWVGYDVEGMI